MKLTEVFAHFITVVEELGIRYLVTGSAATTAFGEPRMTLDVDIVVDLPLNALREFCDRFPAPEFYLSEAAARQAVVDKRQFNILHPSSGFKIDVIIPTDTPFNASRLSRAVRMKATDDVVASYSSPEDVIIKKLEFHREGGSDKHLRDIAGLIRKRGDRLDYVYIVKWAKELDVLEIWDSIREKTVAEQQQLGAGLRMNVLVTGGAGYIGSHAVKHLLAGGHEVVVVDNLSRGHRVAVDARAAFHQADVGDTPRIIEILKSHRIECVMHFAAFANVGESVADPLLYYSNNTAATFGLLRAMSQSGVRKLIFSSTCATFGTPDELPIVETTRQQPINPYGWSKLFVERALIDWSAADPLFSFAALRYFNVAGCGADGSLGEDHDPETHIIPIVLQVALGQRKQVTVFGEDYATPDGTCIRDYIHVDDLCAAHEIAMKALKPGDARFYNLGIGRGHSVREVIESARRVTGHPIPAVIGERRPGDPASLFANADKIGRELGWTARVTELDEVVSSAWKWFESHPKGYDDRP